MIHLNGIEVLAGTSSIQRLAMGAFCPAAEDFIISVSSKLMKNAEARKYPDIQALAFWARPASMKKMKGSFLDYEKRLGRGLCFHIAPSNVPVTFAFSFFFSLLAGNSNIVRVSSKDSAQVSLICEVLREQFELFKDIKSCNSIIRFDKDSSLATDLSKKSDCRMIWGGDATINYFKSLQTAPRCIDLCFSDRFSFAIFSERAVSRLNSQEIKKLVHNFYLDTYLMDQNACSSPKLIVWADIDGEGRKKFWNAVEEYVKEKYSVQASLSVEKLTRACLDAVEIDEVSNVVFKNSLIVRSHLKDVPADIALICGKGGYFYEINFEDIGRFTALCNKKTQTITYFGIDANQIFLMIKKMKMIGVDRIVPVGKALQLTNIWDGFDIINTLSRRVEII